MAGPVCACVEVFYSGEFSTQTRRSASFSGSRRLLDFRGGCLWPCFFFVQSSRGVSCFALRACSGCCPESWKPDPPMKCQRCFGCLVCCCCCLLLPARSSTPHPSFRGVSPFAPLRPIHPQYPCRREPAAANETSPKQCGSDLEERSVRLYNWFPHHFAPVVSSLSRSPAAIGTRPFIPPPPLIRSGSLRCLPRFPVRSIHYHHLLVHTCLITVLFSICPRSVRSFAPSNISSHRPRRASLLLSTFGGSWLHEYELIEILHS
ncbi:hypothetical protein FN846DRAFT_654628 [Sphaerosporella brunnea]|uniref:Uncharacterized protein n=1 Tax=Sphaerosporella brunnea TaxID=1250544 RepID=A0A5J5EZH5_9PEZI|nr:hypothetical protein FN846DRAFT_654628 [Sphaerosporella brunnea]